ncbi:hypothetical protein C8Q73DRAFT_218378 [Cubamyces lactineus]|nr:hypothetical protein C8Q73DRAFT_218378 [Cubamyces lactineus]
MPERPSAFRLAPLDVLTPVCALRPAGVSSRRPKPPSVNVQPSPAAVRWCTVRRSATTTEGCNIARADLRCAISPRKALEFHLVCLYFPRHAPPAASWDRASYIPFAPSSGRAEGSLPARPSVIIDHRLRLCDVCRASVHPSLVSAPFEC